MKNLIVGPFNINSVVCIMAFLANTFTIPGSMGVGFITCISLPDRGDFCCLLITFANSLDLDQD